MPRKMYIIPPGPSDLRGNVFARGAFLGGDFTDFFESRGISPKTIDEWLPEGHDDRDILVVFNHPDDYFFLRALYFFKYLGRQPKKFPVSRSSFFKALSTFSKKVLFQGEPPTVAPYVYRNLDKLLKLYSKVVSKIDLKKPDVGYFILPYDVFKDRDIVERLDKYFYVPKTKFLTMINSNCRPHGFFKYELYSERLKAIKYFSQYLDFDLYGARWNHWPYLHWLYRPYVKKSWRGWIPNKLDVLSRYKFTLCFENSTFPGYVDTKFAECYVAGAVPVYLGAPDIEKYIPADSFIDMRKFKDYAELNRFLRSLSEADIEKYRNAMKGFIFSRKYEAFSRKGFNETVWSYIQPLLDE